MVAAKAPKDAAILTQEEWKIFTKNKADADISERITVISELSLTSIWETCIVICSEK